MFALNKETMLMVALVAALFICFNLFKQNKKTRSELDALKSASASASATAPKPSPPVGQVVSKPKPKPKPRVEPEPDMSDEVEGVTEKDE
jgi:hypothetical protein